MNALVIVDVSAKQVNKPYTYIIPKELECVIELGQRVIVPFGSRKVLGFVVGLNNDEIDNLKPIIEILDITPALNKEMLELSYEIAKKTSSFLISVLKTMIPNALTIKYEKTLKKIGEIKSEIINEYFINEEEIKYSKIDIKHLNLLKNEIKEKNIEVIYNTISKDSIKMETRVKLLKYDFLKNDKQMEILDFLLEKKDVTKKDLESFSESSIKTLEKNGYIELYKNEIYRETKDIIEAEKKFIELNSEQDNAYKKVDLYKNDVYLLYGVTGSGKTEVYLKLIEDALAMGKTALFLVPEISLTPQMASRVKAKFSNCAVFHSGMSDNERYDEWRKIYRGEALVIVGARSAIFAPLKNIGIIIIDEEHEHTYKQDTNPRYHAKDVAILRAKYHNCPLVLGGATPSIDSYYKALNGEYKLLKILHRANNSVLPNMHIINMSEELSFGNKTIFSNTLKNLIQDRLEKNEQIMLLINKRGYSSFYLCRDCGKTIDCPNCDVTLTYHKSTDKLICHYCGYKIEHPSRICPSCKSTRIKDVGIGSETVEETVRNTFNCNVIRMDSDTTSTKGSHAKLIKDFMDKKANVLVGTQMISKGLDFNDVTLVGILMADITLKMPDYRNSERTFDLITQVAGRAGRRSICGDVVVQSFNTNHYSIEQTKYNNYELFYNKEIKAREMAKLPPFYKLSQIVISNEDFKVAYQKGQEIKKEILKLMPNSIIVGPAGANILKINNKFRVQITIKNKDNNELLFNIIERYQDLDIYVDHDPVLI